MCNRSGPRLATGPRCLHVVFVLSDGYTVVDLVAWNVAFDNDAVTHAPLFKSTLMVEVVV